MAFSYDVPTGIFKMLFRKQYGNTNVKRTTVNHLRSAVLETQQCKIIISGILK